MIMTENSIIFIGGSKISRWVANQIDLNVLGFYDIIKSRTTFETLDDAINADADIYVIATPSSDHIHTFSKLCTRLKKKTITILKFRFISTTTTPHPFIAILSNKKNTPPIQTIHYF